MTDDDNLIESPIRTVTLGSYTTPTTATIATQNNPINDANNFLLDALQGLVDAGKLSKSLHGQLKAGYNPELLKSTALALTHKSNGARLKLSDLAALEEQGSASLRI